MLPTILITGGAGYIGKILYWYLRSDQNHLIATTDTQPSRRGLSGNNHYHECDLMDVNAVNALFAKVCPTIVVHLAGKTTVGGVSDDNVIMLNNVMVAMDKHSLNQKHLILAGSAAEYGNVLNGMPAAIERTRLVPLDPYARSKVECFEALMAFRHRLTTTVLRFSNVYGPMQQGRVIPSMIDAVNRGTPVKLNGLGAAVRQFVYIDDVCNAILRVIRTTAVGVFNIGGAQEINMKTLADMVAVAVHEHQMRSGRTPTPVVYNLSHDDPGAFRVVIDSGYAQERLKWYPQTTLYDGLARTVLAQLGT